MNAVQNCARCGARWPVHRAPAQWCPRCNGPLMAPMPVHAGPKPQFAPPPGPPRPQSQPQPQPQRPMPSRVSPPKERNYRWVARRPDAVQQATRPPKPTPGPTPRYAETPRWGLLDPPLPHPQLRRRGLSVWADRAPTWVTIAAVLFAGAALAELGRYIVLLHNRTRLINPWILALSDTAVWSFGILAPIAALIAAIATIGWLARARRRHYEGQGRRDPRRLRTLVLGCLVPVVNLVMPGVFVTEFNRKVFAERRKLIVAWWITWVIGGLMAVGAALFHLADSLQIKADGVLFAVFANAIAALVAVLTLLLIRDIDGQDLLGRRRVAKRLLPATGPAVDIIEPIRPATQKTQLEPEPQEVAAS